MSDSSRSLRPYYDAETFNCGYPSVYRPGIGVVDEHGNTIASKISRVSNSQRTLAGNAVGLGSIYGRNGNRSSIRNIVRQNYNENIQKNMYSDLEFSEYFELSNVNELLKSLLNSFVNNYVKNLIAQPFDVARLLLQVGEFETQQGKNNAKKGKDPISLNDTNNESNDNAADDYDDDADDDDEEEVDYFQTTEESSSDVFHRRTRTVKRNVPKASKQKSKPTKAKKISQPTSHIKPVSLNTIDIMSSLLSQEGARGLWRATNTAFIHNTLSSTLEAWITGFVSPFLNIPDPFFVDVTHSPEPTTTLFLSLGAGVLTGLLLAPLDLIRTKLVVTSLDGNERSLRKSIKTLKFFTCPVSLIIPTMLNSLVNNFFKKLTPYVLFVQFGIDSYGSPMLYNMINLLSSVFELFAKLPVETLLRRAQVSYLLKNSSNSNNPLKLESEEKLVVRFGGYSGPFKTLYDVYHAKGENGGFEALFRGWRVGVLNICGSWGLDILQHSYDDQVLKEEKF